MDFFLSLILSPTKDPLSILNNIKFQRYFVTKGMQDYQVIESYYYHTVIQAYLFHRAITEPFQIITPPGIYDWKE